jgi:hypothetical protein
MSETKVKLSRPGDTVVSVTKVNPTGLASRGKIIQDLPPVTGELPDLPPDDTEGMDELVAFVDGFINNEDDQDCEYDEDEDSD